MQGKLKQPEPKPQTDTVSEQEFQRLLQPDETVIRVRNLSEGRRVDVNPPEGADGCVIMIESRKDKLNASQDRS